MAELIPPLKPQYLDLNGDPLAGGKLYSYEAGTSTPKATYTDQSGATPNSNPVILDADGRASVWVKSGSYKYILTDADDVVQFTIDNVKTIADQLADEGALAVANNLSDLADASVALTNLGIGDLPGDFASHTAATAAHGATGAVMGTTNAQTMTNKKVGDALNFTEQGSDPTAPAADSISIYAKDSNGITRLYAEDSGGYVTPLSGEVFYVVRNTSGATITKGKAVYVTGATGGTANIALAQADAIATSKVLGVATEDIANNAFGRVVSKGELSSFDTSAFAEGSVVYLSSTTAGALTTTEPSHPNLSVRVGVVLVSGIGNGALEIDPGAVEGEDRGTQRNTFAIGDGTAGNKVLEFTNADATKPAIRYNDTDDKFQFANDGATWQDFGSGGGGGFNANPDPYFQDDAWAIEGSPAGITWTVSTTDESLGGAANPGTATLAKDAANRDGQGRKVVIPITGRDRARGGFSLGMAYTDATGFSSGDWAIDIIVTNSDASTSNVLIQGLVSGRELPGVSAGGMQQIRGWIPIEKGIPIKHPVSFSFELVANDGSTAAKSIKFHGPFLGEGRLLNGSRDHDAKDYTPAWTSNGTPPAIGNGTLAGKYSRRGSRLIGNIRLVAGSTTNFGTGVYFFSLPAGLTYDANQVAAGAIGADTRIGIGALLDSGTNRYQIFSIIESTTTMTLAYDVASGSSVTTNALVTNSLPVTLVSGDTIYFDFEVPIAEWAAEPRDVLTSAELMNVTTDALATASGGTHSSSGNWTSITGATWSEIDDEFGTFSNGVFTANVSGKFIFFGHIEWNAGSTTGQRSTRFLPSAGSAIQGAFMQSSATACVTQASGALKLTKGQTVTIQGWQSSGASLAVNAMSFSVFAMPDFSVYGNTGPYEREEYEITTQTDTTASNTWVDVTGSDFTVDPGTHLLGYDIGLQINSVAAAGTRRGTVAIFDSSNNIVEGSVSYASNNIGGNVFGLPASRRVEVTLTAAKSYKLRVRCNSISTDAIASVLPRAFTPDLTDPDNSSIVWHERKR